MSDLRTRAAEAAFLAAVEGGPSSKAWDLVGDSRREMWYEVADAVIAVLSEGLEEARQAAVWDIRVADDFDVDDRAAPRTKRGHSDSRSTGKE